MLNLNNIIKSEGNKNMEVLSISKKQVTLNGKTDNFEYIYGVLCGAGNGVLTEESQGILFELSNISCVVCTDKRATLSQGNKEYSINKVCDGKYYDFNTLVELKDDSVTKETIKALVQLNELTRGLTYAKEMSAIEAIYKLAEYFEVKNEFESALDKEAEE